MFDQSTWSEARGGELTVKTGLNRLRRKRRLRETGGPFLSFGQEAGEKAANEKDRPKPLYLTNAPVGHGWVTEKCKESMLPEES